MEAVILAAGYSSRAKCFKMEQILAGKPVLHHVIDSFIDSCNRVIVVGGYQIEKIEKLVKPYKEKVLLVNNRNYDQGMFSSVQCGIQEVQEDYFFLTPGDYPLLTQGLSQELMQTLIASEKEILIPTYKECGGHPILLSSRHISPISTEDIKSNLKEYLDKNKDKILRYEVSNESILIDMDMPKDYKYLKERMG